jgi:two-component sensor histidine kinase
MGLISAWGAKNAQNLALAFHELATNAAKYGALSNGSGTVRLSWTITGNSKDRMLKIKWRESGGPSVSPPTREGFGSVLLKTAFRGVRLDYAHKGLSCEIDTKLDAPPHANTRA